MGKYSFSMKKILDWRTDEEEAARIQWAEAQKREQQEERMLQQLIQENIQLKEKAALSGRIDAMRQQDLYKKVLEEKIVQQKLVVERAAKETAEANEALKEAHKKKKMMEKLEEKEREQFLENEKKEEQKQLDELATVNFGRALF